MTDNPYQSPTTEPESEARQALGLMACLAAGLWFLTGAGATLLAVLLVVTLFPLTGEPVRWGGPGLWYDAGFVGVVVGTLLAIRSLARSRARAQRLARLRQERMDAIEQLRARGHDQGSAPERPGEQPP